MPKDDKLSIKVGIKTRERHA